MNREKQIHIAASEARAASAETLTTHGTQHHLDDIIGIDLSYDEIAESAFAKGAKWADANPAWRMCEDELPSMGQNVLIAKIDKKTQHISVHIASRHPSDCRYPNGKWIWSGNFLSNNVMAWLPLPKFNLRADKE